MGGQDTRRAARPTTLNPSREGVDEFRPAPTELPRDEARVTEEGRSLPERVISAARAGIGRKVAATLDDPDTVYERAREESASRLAHARRARTASAGHDVGRGGFGPRTPVRPGGTAERTRRMAKRRVRRIGMFRLVLIMAVAGALGSWLGLHLQDAFMDAFPKSTIYGTEKQTDQKPSSNYTF